MNFSWSTAFKIAWREARSSSFKFLFVILAVAAVLFAAVFLGEPLSWWTVAGAGHTDRPRQSAADGDRRLELVTLEMVTRDERHAADGLVVLIRP